MSNFIMAQQYTIRKFGHGKWNYAIQMLAKQK